MDTMKKTDNNCRPKGKMHLRWLIAHQPAYLFVRTAKAFREELNKRCPGDFDIEILTQRDYIEQIGDIPELKNIPPRIKNLEMSAYMTPQLGNREPVKPGFWIEKPWSETKIKWKAFFKGLKEQKFHISQTQITVIGGNLWKQFRVLDLPFLFESHDHVTKSLDGDVGKKLRDGLSEAVGIKSLAFTYSGGYRIIGSNHAINNVDELKNITLQTVPSTCDMFRKVGANAKRRTKLNIQETKDACFEDGAIETTYLRFSGKNILKTNHSMFLTSILVGNELFDELTPTQQAAWEEAAFIVSKMERKWSLEDCQEYEDRAKERGITIKDASPDDIRKLRKHSGASLHKSIKMTQKEHTLYEDIKAAA